MNKIRIICHHAFWFTLLGPLIGFISVIPLFYVLLEYPTTLLSDMIQEWPTVLFIVYLGGSGPALLTGIISACLNLTLALFMLGYWAHFYRYHSLS